MQPQQFAAYLFQGLGRPFLHLQRHAAKPYLDVLLHACLYNPVYDRQFEVSRAHYLYELIELTHQTEWFRQQILDHFAQSDDEMDIAQLFEFAHIFAQQGNQHARQLMYEQFAARVSNQTDSGTPPGAYELIALDGEQAFLFIATQLGNLAARDPEYWDSDYLLQYLEERCDPEQLQSRLNEARTASPAIDRYLSILEQTRFRRRTAASPARQTFQSYSHLKRQLAQTGQRISRSVLGDWGEQAEAKELQQAALDLLTMTDPYLFRQYTFIFDHRPFPLD